MQGLAQRTGRHWVLAGVLLFLLLPLRAAPEFQVEQVPVAEGSELITIFRKAPASSVGAPASVPLLSVLRDRLGGNDPETDRLRYVWVLTSPQPTLLQRAAGSVPFFYWRAGLHGNPDRRPAPAVDLSAPERKVWRSLAGWMAETLAFDPRGGFIRGSAHSYRGNLADSSEVRTMEGLAILSELSDDPRLKEVFSERELVEINTRLMLDYETLGGLLDRQDLDSAYARERARSEETRGHNWELLRQRAEANGLFFESFGFKASRSYALLWVATQSLGSRTKFDGQFLNIRNPYRDPRLTSWKGCREVRDGKEMIPLALYALENPKAPLLLVDFRDTYSPKAHEMLRHFFTDLVTGVTGLSKLANWPYFFGSTAFEFVITRHGEPTNRAARLKAYAEVREWLELDDSMEPGLRSVLQKYLDLMGVNPVEAGAKGQADFAERQYAALLRYAADPNGLSARVQRDRDNELPAYRHSAIARAGYRAASIASLGIYSHREKESGEDLRVQLENQRRIASDVTFLRRVEHSGPQPQIVWNTGDVCRAVEEIGALGSPKGSTQLVEQIDRENCAKVVRRADSTAVTEAQ